MALLGAAVIGFAILFFLIAFVQFTREAISSMKRPKHLVRMPAERPTAKIFTIRETPVAAKPIVAGKSSKGVAVFSPANVTIRRGPAKGSS